MVVDVNFWRNKRVLLTGHTGFKGSWLTLWLKMLGAEIVGYSLPPPTDPSLFELTAIDQEITSIFGDVRDFDYLKQVLEERQPEIIIHLAAQALVRDSYKNPRQTYATNVMGTVNLLEAVRETQSVQAVVVVTSDKCYENREWIWGYRENEAMGGYDPYSNSKGCAELVTAAYRSSFFSHSGVAVASVRAGNVIGGGDFAKDRLVPDLLKGFLDNKIVLIRNPKAVRPWQFVLEPISGYLMLAENLYQEGQKFAEGWNFGPYDKDIKPVSWIADKLSELWGKNASWKKDSSYQPHEAFALKLDSSKARNLLKWEPRLNLETALNWIVDWTKSCQDKANMKKVTENQIAKYMELVEK